MQSEKIIKLLLVGALCNVMPMTAAMELQISGLTMNDGAPIFQAIKANNLGEMQQLMQKKADIEVIDYFSRTPLMIAAQKGSLEAVKLLIAARANIEARDHCAGVRLILATRGVDIITKLREAGVDVPDEEGGNALLIAARRGRADIVQE